MAAGTPRTPSPGALESLERLKVGHLTPKLDTLAQNHKWFQQAVDAPVFSPFFVTSYPNPGKKDAEPTKDIDMPRDVARLLKTNHDNLHQVLDRIQEMMKSSDDTLSAEAQDEFTRLQVCIQHRVSGDAVLIGFQVFSLEFLEQHYTYLSAYYGQFRMQLQRFKNAEARNQNQEAWNKQQRPQFPPDGFELVTDELLNEWHDLRMQYALEFQNEHIKQLQFMRCLKDMEPNVLSKTFIAKSIQSVKLKDEHPLSLDNKHTRTQLRKKSIEWYGSSKDPEGRTRAEHLWCPVLGEMVLERGMKCAHVVPFSYRNVANYIFGDPMHLDIVNRPENTLMVHHAVEDAMDRGRIAFTPVKGGSQNEVTEFRMVIIDPTILEETVIAWKVSTRSC
jgi:hypothetical protein